MKRVKSKPRPSKEAKDAGASFDTSRSHQTQHFVEHDVNEEEEAELHVGESNGYGSNSPA